MLHLPSVCEARMHKSFVFYPCVRKTPPEFGQNSLISVLRKHNPLQINAFILSKNLHNPEVPGSNPGLAT